MNREEGSMYFNLSDAAFEAVCEVANTQDKTLGQALAMLITKGLEALKDASNEKNALLRVEDKVDEPIQTSDVSPCWDENKNDSLNPSNLTARFDEIDKVLIQVLKRIETIPCCWEQD